MARVRRTSKKEQLQEPSAITCEKEINEVDPDELTAWAIDNDRIADDVRISSGEQRKI